MAAKSLFAEMSSIGPVPRSSFRNPRFSGARRFQSATRGDAGFILEAMIHTPSRASVACFFTVGTPALAYSMVAFCLASLMGCTTCSNTVESTAVSPDGQLASRVSERNCGATTDYSSVVNLQRPSDKFDPDNGVLFVAKGQHSISLRWIADKELLVICTSCSRKDVFREVTVTGDIDVRYAAN